MRNARTDRRQGASPSEGTEDEPEHHATDKLDFNALLASPEFQRNLDIICQAVFRRFGASPKYAEWRDLRQETLLNFEVWFRKYEGKANLKTVLYVIAANLCIDEIRRQQAPSRAHVEVGLDEIDLETLPNPITEDTDRRILFQECRNHLSGNRRVIFDEFFTEGRSLREIAKRHRFSPQTGTNILSEILREIRSQVLESHKFPEAGFSETSGLPIKAESRRRRGVANKLSAAPAETAEGKLEQMLLEAGLLSEIPPRITDFTPYQNRKPVRVKGKPVSETIIEERG